MRESSQRGGTPTPRGLAASALAKRPALGAAARWRDAQALALAAGGPWPGWLASQLAGCFAALRRGLALRAGEDRRDAAGAFGIRDYGQRRGGVSGMRHAAGVAVGGGRPCAGEPSPRIDAQATVRDVIRVVRRSISDRRALLRNRIRPLRPSCAQVGGKLRIGGKGLPNLARRRGLGLPGIAGDGPAVPNPVQ